LDPGSIRGIGGTESARPKPCPLAPRPSAPSCSPSAHHFRQHIRTPGSANRSSRRTAESSCLSTRPSEFEAKTLLDRGVASCVPTASARPSESSQSGASSRLFSEARVPDSCLAALPSDRLHPTTQGLKTLRDRRRLAGLSRTEGPRDKRPSLSPHATSLSPDSLRVPLRSPVPPHPHDSVRRPSSLRPYRPPPKPKERRGQDAQGGRHRGASLARRLDEREHQQST